MSLTYRTVPVVSYIGGLIVHAMLHFEVCHEQVAILIFWILDVGALCEVWCRWGVSFSSSYGRRRPEEKCITTTSIGGASGFQFWYPNYSTRRYCFQSVVVGVIVWSTYYYAFVINLIACSAQGRCHVLPCSFTMTHVCSSITWHWRWCLVAFVLIARPKHCRHSCDLLQCVAADTATSNCSLLLQCIKMYGANVDVYNT